MSKNKKQRADGRGKKKQEAKTLSEKKCGIGCKLARATNKTLSYAKNAYKSANDAYDEYKKTNAEYEAERQKQREISVPAESVSRRKTETVREKIVYVPAQKKQSLGSKIYHAIGTAAQNLNENYPEPFSFYNSPATPKAKKPKAPAGYRLVKRESEFMVREVPNGYRLVKSAPKKKTTKPKAPAGYRLVKTTTAKKKTTKRKAQNRYKFLRM